MGRDIADKGIMAVKSKFRYRMGQYAHLRTLRKGHGRITVADHEKTYATARITTHQKLRRIKLPELYAHNPFIIKLFAKPQFSPFRMLRLHTVLDFLCRSDNSPESVNFFILQLFKELDQDLPIRESGHVFELDALNRIIQSAGHLIEKIEIEPVMPVSKDTDETCFKTPDAVLFLKSGLTVAVEFKLYAENFLKARQLRDFDVGTVKASALHVDEVIVVSKAWPRGLKENCIGVGSYQIMNLEGAIEFITQKSQDH